MKPILLVGGGGHCRSCIDVIESTASYKIAGIVEKDFESSQTFLHYPVIGADDQLELLMKQFDTAIVTVGQIKTAEVRIRLFEALKSFGAKLPVIASSYSYVSKNASVGAGSIVMHGAIVNTGADIGENCIVNSQALVEHDSVIGPHCHLSTGTKINGGVNIGVGCFIGSGSIIREGVSIGDQSVIGAGSLVLRDMPANSQCWGTI